MASSTSPPTDNQTRRRRRRRQPPKAMHGRTVQNPERNLRELIIVTPLEATVTTSLLLSSFIPGSKLRSVSITSPLAKAVKLHRDSPAAMPPAIIFVCSLRDSLSPSSSANHKPSVAIRVITGGDALFLFLRSHVSSSSSFTTAVQRQIVHFSPSNRDSF
ncbi:hypothetical protein DEO72_LG3g520 [Vigna unguiculata]|uniref:Uncharacterized protein n=1 Tax=Vigna unguiculata TaxID=3917 RepID=A0A4D6LBS6_VIGUN|nr:hypothetical protein DEO72_LG3g520 [Vigna unguiculata]